MMFITFEGPEGSGKSTQIELLGNYLRSDERNVVLTREPGGTPLGEQLRGLLLEGMHTPAAVTEAYLMTAARSEHVHTVIRPALARGAWVLCDRFYDSTLAYQGAGRGIDIERLRGLQCLATGGLTPDRTILLDIDVLEGLRRRHGSGERNRIDDETVSFHQRVAAWYREEARKDTVRWRIVDGGQPAALVARQILEALALSPSEIGHGT